MALTPREIEDLLRLVARTRDQEIDCDTCRRRVAEYAEEVLTTGTVPARLEPVGHHLSVCPECREEWRALERVLAGDDGTTESE